MSIVLWFTLATFVKHSLVTASPPKCSLEGLNKHILKLNKEIAELKAQAAHNSQKEEMIKSLRESNRLLKEKCEKTKHLEAKIRKQKKELNELKEKLSLSAETEKDLKECLHDNKVLQSASNGNNNIVPHTEEGTSCSSFSYASGQHQIKVPGMKPLTVLCNSEVAGPGWMVIQRRIDGSQDFYRNWIDYRNGFGSLKGEFFIGLENLYHITRFKYCELYIHLEKFNGKIMHAKYSNFVIGDEVSKYKLRRLGAMTGNAGDHMRPNEHRMFTTFDSDNDDWEKGNTAVKYHGGWWYSHKGGSNLNGRYISGGSKNKQSVHWDGLSSIKVVIMMIKPVY